MINSLEGYRTIFLLAWDLRRKYPFKSLGKANESHLFHAQDIDYSLTWTNESLKFQFWQSDKTAVYFGFNVVTCPWRDPSVAVQQVKDMAGFRKTATPEMKERFQGMVQTVWPDTSDFLTAFMEKRKMKPAARIRPGIVFKKIFETINTSDF